MGPGERRRCFPEAGLLQTVACEAAIFGDYFWAPTTGWYETKAIYSWAQK